MGAPAFQDGIWSAPRIAAIIKNEKYAGNALLQKQYVKDHITKKLIVNKGALPKYYVENTHQPIIDMETFTKAQKIMDENRKHYAGKKEDGLYPFTGKIVCGKCGKNFKRKTTHGRISWNCSTFLQFGKKECPAGTAKNPLIPAGVSSNVQAG
jgi:hypothetical protein